MWLLFRSDREWCYGKADRLLSIFLLFFNLLQTMQPLIAGMEAGGEGELGWTPPTAPPLVRHCPALNLISAFRG